MSKEKLVKGMVCPNCGSKLRVIETRQASRDVVVRRRKCPNDSYRCTTHERVFRRP